MKPSLNFNDRISYKLVRACVFLAFGIGLVMSLAQLYWDYKVERRTLDATVQRILEVAKPPAARAVHILDEDLAEEVVNGLLKYKFISSARVYDDLQILLAGKDRAAERSSTRWITRSIAAEFVEYSIPLQNDEFQSSEPGRLVIEVDSDSALTDFFDRTVFVITAGFVRNMLLVILLLVIFYRLLTRPLVALAEEIGKLEPGKLDGDLVYVDESHKADELGLVAARVNGFMESIRNLMKIRAKNEKELLTSKEGLELRTAALQEEVSQREKAEHEALKAKENAEIANRTKSEFLANMSHELRTPLNAVIGFSSIMKDQMFGEMANEKYLEYSKDIVDSSTHLLEVINEILDVSKIEVGEFTLTEEEIEIEELIETALRTMQTTFEKRGQKATMELPEVALRLRGDKVRIRQILFNLLTNASKFTPDQGSIKVSASVLEGGNIQISVRDTGVGIPAQDLERVLEPFAQVDNAFSRSHDGVGLGLSLCNSLMKMHDGELSLESEEGLGTIVYFTFPADRTLN